jgi:hypothetical protein
MKVESSRLDVFRDGDADLDADSERIESGDVFGRHRDLEGLTGKSLHPATCSGQRVSALDAG